MSEINLIVNSDPLSGSTRLSPDGSSFELHFEGSGIEIPQNAKNIKVSMPAAAVWNTIPNITSANNKLTITAPAAIGGAATAYPIAFDTGLYDLDQMNASIHDQLTNAGAQITPKFPLELTPNYSTGKVELVFNYNTVKVDFSAADSVAGILGFDYVEIGTFTTVPRTEPAQRVASLNNTNSVLIHSSIVSEGIRIGNKFSQVIGSLGFTSAPGSQEIYEPFHPPSIQEDYLAGSFIKDINFYITSETNIPITMTEYWSCRLRITWEY